MPDAPDRSQRQACWDSRDAYFGCLDANHVLVPGTEPSDKCHREETAYTKHCIKSWVEYFSKARVGRAQNEFTMKGGDGAGGYAPRTQSSGPPAAAPPRQASTERLV